MRHMYLTVGVLTYNRPKLLRRTVLSLARHICEPYRIVVFDNGSCDLTRRKNRILAHSLGIRLYERRGEVPYNASNDDRERHIAEGHAALAAALLLSKRSTAFILSEDDWFWHRRIPIKDLIRVLRKRPDIGQVRLRSARYDGRLRGYARNNFVTGAPVRWQTSIELPAAHIRIGNLHWTNNPSIVLRPALTLASKGFTSELERMECFATRYLSNAQLVPGCVRHIGPWRERPELLARGVHRGPRPTTR